MKFNYHIAKEKEIETNSLKEVVNDFLENGVGTLNIAIEELSLSITIENKWDEVNIMYYKEWEGASEWCTFSSYKRDIKNYIESEFTKEQIKSIKSIKI